MRTRNALAALKQKGLTYHAAEGTQLKCMGIIAKWTLRGNNTLFIIISRLMLVLLFLHFPRTMLTSTGYISKRTERTHLL